MFSITKTYQDYNDVTRTETFWFNLTQAELIEMEYGVDGGLTGMLERIMASKNDPELIHAFKDLVLKAYGEKSPDGRRFMKTPEIKRAFAETEAYSIIFMELAMDPKASAEFINGIIPTLTPEQQAKIKEFKENQQALEQA